MTKPPGPSRLDDEDTRADHPLSASKAVRHALGKLAKVDDEPTKSVAAPPPESRRLNPRRVAPPAAVGLRAAPKQKFGAPEKLEASRSQVREKIEANKEEHRQRVWDKLDSAKKQGEEKLGRIQPFERPRHKGGG
jgi:hypothetical protein